MAQPSFPRLNFMPSSMISIRSRREVPSRDQINSMYYERPGAREPQYGIPDPNQHMVYNKTLTTGSRFDETIYNNNRTFESTEYNSNIQASGFLDTYDIKTQSRNIAREFNASIKEDYSAGKNDTINTVSLRRQFQPIYVGGISEKELRVSEQLKPLMDNYSISYR